MATEKNLIRAPKFSSIDEEREWFEKHAEEVGGTELAENPFARRGSKVAYSLRLDAGDIEHLEEAAKRRGVRPTQLARELILSGLLADRTAVPPVELGTASVATDVLVRSALPAIHQWNTAIAPVLAQMNAAMAPVVRQWNETMEPVLRQLSAAFAAADVAEAASAAREAERPGQAVFEFVRVLRPDVADEVRGTDADPSEDDARLPMFFERVAVLAA